MREMPRTAGLYLGCYLCGLAALIWLAHLDTGLLTGGRAWAVTAVLIALAATAQIFTVARTTGHYSDHLTPAPLFAAVLLLPAPLLALAVCCTFIPEWIVRRRRWFTQLFHLSAWLTAAAVARALIRTLAGQPIMTPAGRLNVIAILLAMLAFLAITTISLALELRLTRRQPLRETGLFLPIKLISEIALLCSGWAFAAAWTLDPFYAIPAVLPLVIIFQALHVPNLIVEATTDPKTGLANTRQINTVLDRELERAERTGQVSSVLMCDLDFLRTINNTYGHQIGDRVLVGVAEVIRHNVRACDLAGRFGGEEFIVFLQDATREEAQLVGERIRAELERQRFPTGEGRQTIGATVSIGVASYPEDGRTTEALVREADLALYQAKREGRNCIVAAGRASRQLVGEWARENVAPVPPSSSPDGRAPFVPLGAQTLAQRVRPLGDRTPSRREMSRPAARHSEAPAGRGQRVVTEFIACCLFVALLLLMPTIRQLLNNDIPWLGLLFFTALVIAAELLAVDLDDHSRISVSVVAILAAAFLYGPIGILLVTAMFVLWAKIRSHGPPNRMLFNFSMILLASVMSNGVFQLATGGGLGVHPFERLAIPAILAGLVYFVVNHALLAAIRSLHEGRSARAIFRHDYQWLWPYYAVFGLLGMTGAEMYRAFGWACVLVLTAPVAIMRLSMKQHMERTALHVNELKLVNRRLTDSYEATLQALSRALDTRDEETEEHSQRVRRYSQLIATHFGLSAEEIEHLCRGALLHDIGKIGVPDAVLLKRGGLTPAETELMRRHPTIGFTMIAHIPFLAKAAEVVLHHHEAYDGSGYPSRLDGHRIPLAARIFTVVDALDAMTSDRPYRAALSFGAALEEIRRCAGTQFDPQIVEVLLAIPIEELVACSQDARRSAVVVDSLIPAVGELAVASD